MTPGGHAAVNFEHSWGDGVAVLRYFEEIYKDRKHQLPSCQPTMEGVQRLEADLSPDVQEGVASSLEQVKDTCSTLSMDTLQYKRFGKDLLKKMKLSPDAVLQLAIQVSYYSNIEDFRGRMILLVIGSIMLCEGKSL